MPPPHTHTPFIHQGTEVQRVLVTSPMLHSPEVIEEKFKLISIQYEGPRCSENVLSVALHRGTAAP